MKHFIPAAALFLTLSCLPLLAQNTVGLQTDRLPHRKVEKLLEKQNVSCTGDLDRVQSSCYSSADSLRFNAHYMSFEFKASPEEVWDAYTQVEPARAWDCKLTRFAFLYNKQTGNMVYSGDRFQGLREGQIFYINLKFLGIVNLAVGSEVKTIDAANKKIRFCYLESGKSRGSQWIQLTRTEEGHTLVEHYTRYKSDSPFRDSKLYPWLHGKILTNFHENVRELVLQRQQELTASTD